MAAPDTPAQHLRATVDWRVASLLTLGALIRLAWTLEWSRLPLWTHFRLDAEWYRQAALDFAAGDWLLGDQVLHMSPLYSWVTGLAVLVFGHSPWVVPLLQLALAVATLYWIWRACHDLLSPRAALGALAFSTVFAPLVFYSPLWLAATLTTALSAWQLASVARIATRPSPPRLAWAELGLASGLAVIARPNALLLLPALGVFALSRSATSVRQRIARAAIFSLVALSCIAPVTARNVLVANEPVLVTDSGGLNFFIGNGPGATGTFRIPAEVPQAYSAEAQFELFTAFAEAATGRELGPREVDAWWYDRTWSHIGENRAQWAALLATKVRLFFNGHDIPNTYSLPFARALVGWMQLLPGFGFVAGLAVWGTLCFFAARDAGKRIVAVTIVLFVVMLTLFFVLGHYRLPATPWLIVAAAGGTLDLLDRIRQRAPGAVAALAVVGIVSVGASQTLLSSTISNEFFKLGFAWQTQGDDANAEDAYLRALEHNADEVSALKNLGVLYARRGAFDAAQLAFVEMEAAARRLGYAERIAEAQRLQSELEATRSAPTAPPH